jgi:hypothetical protein
LEPPPSICILIVPTLFSWPSHHHSSSIQHLCHQEPTTYHHSYPLPPLHRSLTHLLQHLSKGKEKEHCTYVSSSNHVSNNTLSNQVKLTNVGKRTILITAAIASDGLLPQQSHGLPLDLETNPSEVLQTDRIFLPQRRRTVCVQRRLKLSLSVRPTKNPYKTGSRKGAAVYSIRFERNQHEQTITTDCRLGG